MPVDSELSNCKSFFGPYDCMLNAVCYILCRQNYDANNLLLYNWDIRCSSAYGALSGSLSVAELTRFLFESYGVEFKPTTDVSKLGKNIGIVPLDAYYLPYIQDFYLKDSQLHYVVAEGYENGQIIVVDPFYKVRAKVDSYIFQASNETLNRERAVLVLASRVTRILSSCYTPYILGIDFEEAYRKAYDELIKLILSYKSQDLDIRHTLPKKTFGMLRSTIKSRETFFYVRNTSANDTLEIMGKWRHVEKNYAKFFLGYCSENEIFTSIRQLFESEVAYLTNMK